jgi:ubiquinone/menaquinone biosynthesis C-methylase UbiE
VCPDVRFVDLSAEERQAANRGWWAENPMTYRVDREPGTPEWFDHIDRRFLHAAYFANDDRGTPFGRFMTPEVAAGQKVLEIGCGMGTHAALLIKAGADYTGVDLTERAVAMTRRRLELSRLPGAVHRADAEHLPFADASFDTVWSWGVIHHSASFDRCLSEITRVLRPGGHVMVMVYHHPSLFYYLYCVVARGIGRGELRHRSPEAIYLDQIDGAYARRFGRSELARLFARDYESISIDVMGQKEELYPLPQSRLKRRLVASTPDRLASAVLSRLGHLVVVQGVRSS